MKALLPLILAAVALSCTQPKPAFDRKTEEAAIRKAIDKSQIDWNNGDLEAFMESYWKSDSLQFISYRGISWGWQATLEGYKKAYPDRAAMGTLRFEILKITPLSDDVFVVTGKYFVTRLSNNLEGVFTLVLRKIDGRWVAIYDHTS